MVVVAVVVVVVVVVATAAVVVAVVIAVVEAAAVGALTRDTTVQASMAVQAGRESCGKVKMCSPDGRSSSSRGTYKVHDGTSQYGGAGWQRKLRESQDVLSWRKEIKWLSAASPPDMLVEF